MFVFSIPAGTDVPSHTAPHPYVSIVLSGTVEIVASDGVARRFNPGICAGGFFLPRRATVCRFDTVRCQLTSARDLHAVAVAVARASKVEMLFFPAEANDDRTAITVPAGFYPRGLG